MIRFVHPQDGDSWEALLRDIARGSGGQAGIARLRLLTREGKYRWVEIRARLFPREGPEQILGTLADITDQVQSEDLHEAEFQNLADMVHSLPTMLYRCRNDRDWTMHFVSEGAYKLTGFSGQELLNNRTVSYGSLVHSQDQDKVWEQVQAALREHRTFELLYRIITAQGYEKWVWERGQGVFSKGEDLLGIEGFITEAPQPLKRFTNRAEQAHLYDPLRGYPTKALLLDRINSMIHRASVNPEAGFVFLVLGVANRDDLLSHLGQAHFEDLHHRILACVQTGLEPTASVAVLSHFRIGILLPERHSPRGVGALVDRLRLCCQNGFDLHGKRVDLDLNIGIAMSQSEWTSSEEVLESADQAMNQAGAIGGTREMITDQYLQGEMVGYTRLAQALPEALQRGDIRLEVVPIYQAPDEDLWGWYARLVWPQKRGEPIPLAEILPAARNRDLAPFLEEKLCRELAEHLAEWGKEFMQLCSGRILLRLDAPEFLEEPCLQRLLGIVRDHGVWEGSLLPAVPTHLLPSHPGGARGPLAQFLDHLGTGLVLDDFTGDFESLARWGKTKMVRLAPAWIRENREREAILRAVCIGTEAYGLQVIASEMADQEEAQSPSALPCSLMEGPPDQHPRSHLSAHITGQQYAQPGGDNGENLPD